ncbi:hypothetical protein ACLB2K_038025 [Fragaria x ananassa]
MWLLPGKLHDTDRSYDGTTTMFFLFWLGTMINSLWPRLFAKLAEKRDFIGDLIMNPVGSAQAPVAMDDPAAATSAAAPAVEEKKKKEEEPEKGSDDDMPLFDLFK